MSIWFRDAIETAELNALNANTMGAHIGIAFTEAGPDYIIATMPVDHRTRQPYDILHGGASAVLAETLGSVASAMVIDHAKYMSLGIEINCNHVRSARKGLVTGVCKPLHLGSTLHVWDIRIFDASEKLICISRLTVMIKKR
ncbi:MAG: hotdog fold thioesterase [Chitinophagales bacterium]